ncbi:MAG: radical SAM protein [Sphaerochaeta sp.]
MQLSNNDIHEIELELTGTCDLSCPLCTRNYLHANHQKVKNVRSLEIIVDQLKLFKNLKHLNLAGTVSEPTLYPQFIELISWIVSYFPDISIDLYSNASKLNKDLWTTIGELFTNPNQRVIFTVCGTTQDLHEKYRVGSKLENVLENAQYFKNSNSSKSDWIQYIIFEYNLEDSRSSQAKDLINTFNNFTIIGSEGVRYKNEYNKSFDQYIRPVDTRDKLIKNIFKQGEQLINNKQNACISCKSFNQKRIYIDQFGKCYACYNLAEFEPQAYFKDDLDFSDIKNFKYNDCFKCDSKIQYYVDKMGLDFIC